MPKSATFKRSTLFINMHAPIRLAQATFSRIQVQHLTSMTASPRDCRARHLPFLSYNYRPQVHSTFEFDVVEVLYNKPSELHNATARSPANTLRKPNYGYDVIYSFLQPPAGVSQLA